MKLCKSKRLILCDDDVNVKLCVPITRRAESWWNPTFWSIARPTDFAYGDFVLGLDCQPVWLSVIDWQTNVMRREELEYDMPDDEDKYVAAPINRF